MRIFDFERIARSDRTAERYLLDSIVKTGPIACPQCRAEKLYAIEGGARRRCVRCGHSFHPWNGRWIGEVKISAKKWLWIVKFFELEMPASKISAETGVSYPTCLKALNVVRRSLAAPAADEVLDRSPAAGTEPVIGTLETRDGGAEIYGAVSPEAIRCILRMAGGYLVAVDRSLAYASMHYRGQELAIVDKGDRFPFWRVYCSGKPGVWHAAKTGLVRHHGVSGAKLPLYIREMEFRYLNRHRDLFDLIVERICGPAAPADRSLALISV